MAISQKLNPDQTNEAKRDEMHITLDVHANRILKSMKLDPTFENKKLLHGLAELLYDYSTKATVDARAPSGLSESVIHAFDTLAQTGAVRSTEDLKGMLRLTSSYALQLSQPSIPTYYPNPLNLFEDTCPLLEKAGFFDSSKGPNVRTELFGNLSEHPFVINYINYFPPDKLSQLDPKCFSYQLVDLADKDLNEIETRFGLQQFPRDELMRSAPYCKHNEEILDKMPPEEQRRYIYLTQFIAKEAAQRNRRDVIHL
ncbi:MAG: hypothetical protein NTY73_00435 [Candidatus Micrarchaeota archaeon]|nr:hypothetical protein [Candidatus Micrarchaeota archaeon]